MQNTSLRLVFCFALIISAGCIDAPGDLTPEEDTASAVELELPNHEPAQSALAGSELAESELLELELAGSELAEPELAEPEWESEYQWYCEGWYGPWFQYCLTQCTGNSTLHPVGSENTIAYGACTAAAESHCRDMRWGSAYGQCWGFHY